MMPFSRRGCWGKMRQLQWPYDPLEEDGMACTVFTQWVRCLHCG